jgi:hypothetical protein
VGTDLTRQQPRFFFQQFWLSCLITVTSAHMAYFCRPLHSSEDGSDTTIAVSQRLFVSVVKQYCGEKRREYGPVMEGEYYNYIAAIMKGSPTIKVIILLQAVQRQPTEPSIILIEKQECQPKLKSRVSYSTSPSSSSTGVDMHWQPSVGLFSYGLCFSLTR